MTRQKNSDLAKKVLACPMNPEHNDANVTTVRNYLIRLLDTLWYKEEGFDSKRPFGNSGWQGEVYTALVQNKLLSGEMDEYFATNYDEQKARNLVQLAIESLYE